MGFQLSDEAIDKILPEVKRIAYQLNRAVFPDNELKEIFTKYQ
jgi:hypothetical protein